MNEHIGVAMTKKAHGMRNFYAAKDKTAVGDKAMDIVPHAYADIGHNYTIDG